MESAPPMLEKTTGMSFENEYKIEQENIKYIFKIGKLNNKEESLILFVSQEEVMSSDVYQKSFDLKELQELNKTFRAFDTLNEVKDFLKEIIQEKVQKVWLGRRIYRSAEKRVQAQLFWNGICSQKNGVT